MEVITKNVEPIKIGFPTNSRIAEDCAPMREALELEGNQGAFTSRFVPDAVFRIARVKDISRFIQEGIYQIGIIGDDTAIEASLEEDTGDWANFRPESMRFFSRNKWAVFDVKEPSVFTLFGTEAIRDKFNEQRPGQRPVGKILTSYPQLAEKMLYCGDRRLESPQRNCARVVSEGCKIISGVDGQIESIVANVDIPGVVAGMDIVRTGETLKSFRLVPICGFLESRPGIWSGKEEKVPECQKIRIPETIRLLKERLAPFLTAGSLIWSCDAP